MGQVMDGTALAEAVAAVKAYLRLEGVEEDEVIGGMTSSAAALCEAFVGQWLVARDGEAVMEASAAWRRLPAGPVLAISGVEAVSMDGPPLPLPSEAYEIDIDAHGDGWVRVTDAEARCVKVTYRAGLATAWSDVPEPLRQGVVRLAAHFYTGRDKGGDAGPPAAVTALWRPWRRMPFGGRMGARYV